MLVKRFVVVIAVMLLLGCAKKPEAENTSMETQEILNQATNTQTELTLLQDGTVKNKNAKPTTAASAQTSDPASAVAETPAPASASSPSIEDIQRALKNASLYTGKIDGDFGPKTKKAIRTFQEQNGLKADGKVGAKTWVKLQTYLNKAQDVDFAEVRE